MFIKFSPNEYVLRYKKGKIVSKGAGLAFFYVSKKISVCSIPISSNDADFFFEETTSDFQTVTIQGQITYKIVDYLKIASSMNFTVNLKTKKYEDNPIAKLSKRIVNICEVLIKSYIGNSNLTDAIKSSQNLASQVFEKIQNVDEIKELGISVTGLSILKVVPNKDTSRALEAKTREDILQKSDDALYERRNASIEQERRVKENELNTEISVAEKKKTIKETEIQTRQMVLEKENELEKIKSTGEAEREQIKINAEIKRQQIKIDAEIEIEKKRRELAQLRFENAKKEADAEAYRISAVMEAYAKISPEVLVALANINIEPEKMIAQAFDKLALNSGKIGTLNITPDLLESLTGKAK